MKLVKVVRSEREGKKWKAIFEPRKTTHFGAVGYQSYIDHHDKERRRLYRERHQKDLKTNDHSKAGFLSYYILWGDSTSLQENVKSYKKRFNL